METEIAGKDRSGSDPTVLELSDGVFGVECSDTEEIRLTGLWEVIRTGDCTDVHGSRERVTGTRWFDGRMAVRCTDGIEGCRAEYVLTGLGVINDCFWNASKAGVLSV
ncbi:hypothetical protein DY000_02037419 [Brassica cretica]|uniref:Uncharacterized protein n=1 Tax=Brassica cretica TaxID=69181 RepID=A0ABQ7BC79_BRACR|nr:hypothetical protein DY000_02037419 [Brassica cretica]